MTAFSLARRLRAGETVYAAWCTLASPIVAETIAREGFAAVVLDIQHGLWDTASIIAGIGALHHAGAAPVVRVPLNDFAFVSPRARFRRRGDHRADDQHAPPMPANSPRCAKFPPLGERSWGPQRAMTLQGKTGDRRLSARGQRRHAHAGDDRDAGRARQCRCDCRHARHRCAVHRALRSVDRVERRQGAGRAGARGRARRSTRSARRRKRPAKFPASIAATPSARWPWPSAASASSPSAAILASCARARRRRSRR